MRHMHMHMHMYTAPPPLNSVHPFSEGLILSRSGSMEPAFYRGDILFLHMGYTPFRSGDIVVFKVADREIPIVHRIIKVSK